MNASGLIFVAAGIFSICGAAFDWDWFINSYKARFFVTIFGRTGARIFYGLLGIVIVVMGLLMMLDVLYNPRDRRSPAVWHGRETRATTRIRATARIRAITRTRATTSWSKQTMSRSHSAFGRKTTSHLLFIALLLGASLAGAARAQNQAATAEQNGFLRVEGPRIVDPQGRVVVLRGLNTGNVGKDGVRVYGPLQQELKKNNAAWGFNCMRLVFVWEGLEPEPGKYDRAYLKQIEDLVGICRDAGVWAVLDMHQDLFARGQYGGNGAPKWACHDKGLAMHAAPYWGLNYLQPPVTACFDAFWADAPGPDGTGIQTHYIKTWQYVAEHFKDDATVAGYDLMNEPYPGSDMASMIGAFVSSLGKAAGPAAQAKWQAALGGFDPKTQYAELTAPLRDPRVLDRVLKDTAVPVHRFETAKQQPFYDRLVTAIRQVDPRHICFFEPIVIAGCGVETSLRPPRAADGTPHGNLVFAPHYYLIPVEIGLGYGGDADSVRWSIGRGCAAGSRMGLPVWFGEWCSPSKAAVKNDRFFRDQLDAFDSQLIGWAAWDWERLMRPEALKHLTRPYVRALAGEPRAATCKNGRMELKFKPDPAKGDTLIWFPPSMEPQIEAQTAAGRKADWWKDADGLVHLRPAKDAEACTLKFKVYDVGGEK
jgi:endoglycosylceramidase